jgi:hypothetical protein
MAWGDIHPRNEINTYLSRDSVRMQLRRTVIELFRGILYDDAARHKHIFPSIAASFADSRSKGGSFRSLRNFAHASGLCLETKGEDGPTASRVLIREIENDERNVEEHIGLGKCFVADICDVELAAKELYESLIGHAMHEQPYVKAVGLAESLKVRVITKGAPYTSKILHPLQKFMWRVLKNHPTFFLVGSPVTARAVQDRLGKVLKDDQYYLSGDYSDATNQLAPWVTNCIAEAIADEIGLRPEERELLLRSLTGNIVVDEGEHKQQLWGQLMGSIVSFPILCIANAALCRWSLEVDRQRQCL